MQAVVSVSKSLAIRLLQVQCSHPITPIQNSSPMSIELNRQNGVSVPDLVSTPHSNQPQHELLEAIYTWIGSGAKTIYVSDHFIQQTCTQAVEFCRPVPCRIPDTYILLQVLVASFPGLLTPAFVACRTNVGCMKRPRNEAWC